MRALAAVTFAFAIFSALATGCASMPEPRSAPRPDQACDDDCDRENTACVARCAGQTADCRQACSYQSGECLHRCAASSF
ncbi:MAG TPA: hypothetical protein VFF06_19625 [Polyangia bacterium]|nr:hypothetical protein [Polyangia bacterium]